jgi:DNA-binding Xre family transcriptional regulator
MVRLNLEYLLKKHNKSKYWLVKGLESNYTAVNNMIYGVTAGIRFETLDKLCDLFGCEPGDLFIREE